jgi:hypothetical protein
LRLVRQLICNGAVLLRLIGKRRDITEGAAAAANSAIAIRAAKPPMQGQLMHLFTMAMHKIPTKHID